MSDWGLEVTLDGSCLVLRGCSDIWRGASLVWIARSEELSTERRRLGSRGLLIQDYRGCGFGFRSQGMIYRDSK